MLTLFFDCETTGLNKHPLTHERYQPECTNFMAACMTWRWGRS